MLDANVFIEAAGRYYAFEFRTPFWDRLLSLGQAGRICTIDRIAAEITGGNELETWINSSFSNYIEDSSIPEVVPHYAALMEWSQQARFTDAAKSQFATVADAWLVAYAKAIGGIVVTHEKNDPNTTGRVLVPIACRQLGVQYVDTFAMLRHLGVRFDG